MSPISSNSFDEKCESTKSNNNSIVIVDGVRQQQRQHTSSA